MPTVPRSDQIAPVIIEKTVVLPNTARPFGISVSQMPNLTQKIPVNESIRHESAPFAVDDPLNNYGGQDLP